jgi:hypothetical protein
MALALHPFVIGQAFGAEYLDQYRRPATGVPGAPTSTIAAGERTATEQD